MSELNTILKALLTKYKTNQYSQILNTNITKKTNHLNELTNVIKEYKEELNILERKNKSLETEIIKNRMLIEKNADKYQKLNSQRISLNKELIENENVFDKLEEEENKLKNMIDEGKEVIENINYSLHDKIFLEFAKGMGVQVMDEEFKIVNYKKNEIHRVKGGNENEMWKYLE